MNKKRFLVLTSIMGMAFIMAGCKDKKTTTKKDTTIAPTTVVTTATPTTTEAVEKFQVTKEVFDSFFAYDFDGLANINIEYEVNQKSERRNETCTMTIDGYCSVYKSASSEQLFRAIKDEDKWILAPYMKNGSGEWQPAGSAMTDFADYREICTGFFLPILDFTKMTFNEATRTYESSEVIESTVTLETGTTNYNKWSKFTVKFYDNKPTVITFENVFRQTGTDFDFSETTNQTNTIKSIGQSKVVDPTLK